MKSCTIGKGAHGLEIDEPLDQILERIDIERIEVVGRKIVRQQIEPRLHRRALERRERQHPFDHRALHWRQIAVVADGTPEIGEPLLRFRAAAARQSVGKHHRIDGAGGRTRNAFEHQAPVSQKVFEHAPGECAMRTAALKREIDALGPRRARRLGARPGNSDASSGFNAMRAGSEASRPHIVARRQKIIPPSSRHRSKDWRR